MITKEQALEFIYELLQEYQVTMQLNNNTNPYMEIYSSSAGTFHFTTEADSVEDLTTKFIIRYMNTNLFENIEKIPVDVDMLEVGQTYKVELDDFYDGGHSVHIAKYEGKKEEYYYFKNRHTWRYEKRDLYQLWRMNNKESEER